MKILRYVALLTLALMLLIPATLEARTKAKTKKENTTLSDEAAFPQTTIEKAEVALRKAAKVGNAPEVVANAVKIVNSNLQISTDRFQAMASLLDSLATVSTNVGERSLLYMLEANLYSDKYSQNSWQYRQRKLPLTSIPENVEEWSSDMFALKIHDLVSHSIAPAEQLSAIPSTSWKPLLSPDTLSTPFYPSLYSILAAKALTYLANFKVNPVVPFYKNPPANTPGEKCTALAEEIKAKWYFLAEKRSDVAEMSVAIVPQLSQLSDMQKIERLLSEYERWKASPYAMEFLALAAPYLNNSEDNGEDASFKDIKQTLIANLTTAINQFPNFPDIARAKQALNLLQLYRIKGDLPEQFTSSTPCKFKCKVENLQPGYYFSLYKIISKNYKQRDWEEELASSASTKFIKSIPIALPNSEGFSDSLSVDFGKLPVGKYLLCVSTSAGDNRTAIDRQFSARLFTVSDLHITTTVNSADASEQRIYVLDASNGKPLPGIDVKIQSSQNQQKTLWKGKTNEEGFIPFPSLKNNNVLQIEATRNQDQASLFRYVYPYTSGERLNAKVFTDLSIYHPGDTCKFSILTYAISSADAKIGKNVPLKVFINDASYKTVTDTLNLQTDEYGRCTGSFVLPASGLQGQWRIVVQPASPDRYIRIFTTATITVQDYKQPSFFIDLKSRNPSYTVGDTIQIEGQVSTYSGMGLPGVNVKLRITPEKIWRYASEVHEPFTATAITDASGNFILTLPTENLKDTPFANSRYTVLATATSDAGESQESEQISFDIGNVDKVSIQGLPENVNATIRESIKVRLISKSDAPIRYNLRDAKDTVLVSDETQDPTVTLNIASLPSGEYKLVVMQNGNEVSQSFIIYRDTDTCPPIYSPLWVPETAITAQAGEKTVKVHLGSSCSPQYVLYTISSSNSILNTGVIKFNNSNSIIEVPAPEEYYKYATVSLYTVNDSKEYSTSVKVSSAISAKILEPEILSFRDKISAANHERWSFRYRFGNTVVEGIPVMAVMTDKALNHLSSFKWETPSIFFSNYDIGRFFGEYSGYTSFNTVFNSTYYTLPVIKTPWNGIDFLKIAIRSRSALTGNVVIRGVGTMNGSEVAADQVVGIYGVASKESLAAPKAMAKAEAVEEEVASVSADDAESVDTDSEAGSFRPAECPVAFFMPELRTDENGVVELSFVAPDFNTTWQLQMLGYMPDMVSNVMVKDIVASKPVMVSANAPRFLRTGDVTTLKATLFNNTDEEAVQTAYIEIFDPLTDKVLFRKDFAPVKMRPKGNHVVAIDFTVPSDVEFIGYKVMSSSGRYSDGEQSLIAIRPSSAPVVNSYPFYLNPGQKEWQQVLPAFGKDATVTLSYCDNPIWECVTALPDLTYDNNASIFSRVNKLYGNALAVGLMKKYPALNAAIEEWSEKGDSTLISPLEKDSQLKVVALENTPWSNNAAAETLRMQRLTSLLDTEAGEKAIKDALQELQKQQTYAGGWSWCPDMPASQYITGQVLWRIAMLKDLECLPSDASIDKMIRAALSYCDNEMVKMQRKQKQVDGGAWIGWLYIRSFFKNMPSDADFTAYKKKALEDIKKSWKDYSIYNKATAATLLWREGYQMEARSILESLRQLATTTPSRGVCFDNLRSSWYSPENTLISTMQALEAFREIEPSSAMIDGLRQWLIVERQAQDWGSNPQLAELIYVILASGSDWITPSQAPVFQLGEKKIEAPQRALLTGSFTCTLPTAEASGARLSLARYSTGPAWGSVFVQYIAPIESVKQFSESDVRITKRLLRVIETEQGTKVEEATGELPIGSRVRVELTVNCARDIDYGTIVDERSGCLAPADQISGFKWQDGIGFYREVRTDVTNFYFSRLPRGTFIITYDCFVSQAGSYADGIATLQSLYAPSLSAHSAGRKITTK